MFTQLFTHPISTEKARQRKSLPGLHLQVGTVGFWVILDSSYQDLRVAIRALRRSPGTATVAALTLALGIGANSALFGVIKTVVLTPLPFTAPDRVVQLWDLRPSQERGVEAMISLDNFRDYESLTEVRSHVLGAAKKCA